MINPNYPSYSVNEKDESLDLTPITDALESLKKAVMSNKAKDSVDVTNFDEVKKHLRMELGFLAKQLAPLIEANEPKEFPKSIEVSNLPKPEKAPDSIKVTNLNELGNLLTDLIQSVNALNVTPVVNIPAPIVNIPPSEAPVINVPPQMAPIVDINIEALLSALQPLRLLSRDPNKPITVRMSDGRNFIDALTQTLKDNGDKLATVVSTSYGLTKDEFKAAQRELDNLNGKDFSLQVSRGLVSGITSVNKFGAAPSGVQTTATDIWSRANATPTQQIWVAPTTARVHAIASTSDNDGKTGSPTSTGARTIRVYGLTSWSTAEVNEDITLDGTTAVNTVNSYVIIHRMKVLTCGTSGPNVGTISATAATDGTVTAVILPTEGQTEMAIYGVPSVQSFYLTRWYAGIARASGVAVDADFHLLVNEIPHLNLTNAFLYKSDLSLQSTGTSSLEKHYDNPIKYSGPCIIKVQATASANDVDAQSGFDGYLVTN